MKFRIEHTFDFPLEQVLKAREYRYKNLEEFPEFKNLELVSREQKEDICYQKTKIHLEDSVPIVLQPFLKDLCLLDDAEFDTKKHIHRFRIQPVTNPSAFFINGVSNYKSLDSQSAARDYEIEVKSSVLFVGAMIESIICDIYKKNLKKDKINITEYLKSKKNT